MIYESYDLIELTNIAVTHSNNYAAAEILYHQKYNHFKIVISGLRNPGLLYDFHDANTIVLYDFYLTLSVLKLFGHSIGSLKLDFEAYSEEQRKITNQYINKYCAETLTSI